MALAWVRATIEMQSVLKREIESLEKQIHEWEPRVQSLSQRFAELYEAEAERDAERWGTLHEM